VTDFAVSLTDVFMDSKTGKVKSMLVSKGILNMKWRNSRSKAIPMTPGIVYEAEVDLGFTCYIFNKGHKIRLGVTSSDWPAFTISKNFVSADSLEFLNNEKIQENDIITGKYAGFSSVDETQRSQGVVAKNSVWFSRVKYPSHITLPIVSIRTLMTNKV